MYSIYDLQKNAFVAFTANKNGDDIITNIKFKSKEAGNAFLSRMCNLATEETKNNVKNRFEVREFIEEVID